MPHLRDKHFARFLWFKVFDKLNVDNIETAEYQIYRVCHFLYGVSSSTFLLTGTLIHHMTTFSSIDPDFVHKILKLLHAYDLCSGDASIQSPHNFYMKCEHLLLQPNFTFQKFESNSPELEQMINGKVHELSITKILGLQCNKVNDTIIFDMKKLETLMIIETTKRTFIQFFASIYDLLGLINFRKFVFQRLIGMRFFHRTF